MVEETYYLYHIFKVFSFICQLKKKRKTLLYSLLLENKLRFN